MNLGDLYLEKERFVDAAETYKAFVEQDPHHAKSPLLQFRRLSQAYKRRRTFLPDSGSDHSEARSVQSD